MGTYSKTLSKRLRQQPNDPTNLNFVKVCFEKRYSREQWRNAHMSGGMTAEQANNTYDWHCSMEFWESEDFWVTLDKQCQGPFYEKIHKTFDGHQLWHLKINRSDDAPCRDWRTFQAIKDKLVGPEYEAIELYPAHSRLMDVGNTYHLWILAPKDDQETPPQFNVGRMQV
jgi:hypothetical protein